MVGLQVSQGEWGIKLTQATYVSKMLEELGLTNEHPVRLPIAGGDVKSVNTDQAPTADPLGASGCSKLNIMGTGP